MQHSLKSKQSLNPTILFHWSLPEYFVYVAADSDGCRQLFVDTFYCVCVFIEKQSCLKVYFKLTQVCQLRRLENKVNNNNNTITLSEFLCRRISHFKCFYADSLFRDYFNSLKRFQVQDGRVFFSFFLNFLSVIFRRWNFL